MVQITEEPLSQKKYCAQKLHGYSPEKPYVDPKQDDYFIIGPTDKFAPSIAYRNRLKYRSRSISPQYHRGRTKTAQPPKQHSRYTDENIRRTIHRDLVKPHKNEAIQTEGPRKALEDEIKRIRSELEQRKYELKEKRTYSQVPPQKGNSYESNELKLNLSESPQVTQPYKTPQAPRPVKKKHSTEYISDPGARSEKRRRSLSPLMQPRLTEYQRAYKAPQLSSIPRRPRTAQTQSKSSPQVNFYQDQTDTFKTEYTREYKPFKYVPVDQLNSMNVIRDGDINIVPIPRPKSACTFKRTQQQKQPLKEYRKRRPQTPPPDAPRKASSHKKGYITEYGAKYRSYFNLQSDCVESVEWAQELEGIRKRADLYRKRGRESHFTREHLAQLDSAFVDYWDQPSSDRYAQNYEKYRITLELPPAGKPSWLCRYDDKEGEGEVITALRRCAMLDSHNVAELLDQQHTYTNKSYSGENYLEPKQNSFKNIVTSSIGSKNSDQKIQQSYANSRDTQSTFSRFDDKQPVPTSTETKTKTQSATNYTNSNSKHRSSPSLVSTDSIISSVTPVSEPTGYTYKQRNQAVTENHSERKSIYCPKDYLYHPDEAANEYRSWEYI